MRSKHQRRDTVYWVYLLQSRNCELVGAYACPDLESHVSTPPPPPPSSFPPSEKVKKSNCYSGHSKGIQFKTLYFMSFHAKNQEQLAHFNNNACTCRILFPSVNQNTGKTNDTSEIDRFPSFVKVLRVVCMH